MRGWRFRYAAAETSHFLDARSEETIPTWSQLFSAVFRKYEKKKMTGGAVKAHTVGMHMLVSGAWTPDQF